MLFPLMFSALKYKGVKLKAIKIDGYDAKELEKHLTVLREETAPKLADLILRMGCICVKIGQVMSTIGQGPLSQQYMDAMKPLQNDVPPGDTI